MKNILAFAAVLTTMFVSADTVILYDDGSQYTVEDNEHIFISNYQKLYYQQRYSRGDVLFHLTLPNTKRDVEYIENPNPVGSHEWCESHDLHANGYTFEDQVWYKSCDSNNDGVYDLCDWYEPTGISTFDEIEWQDKCNDGDPWDGSQAGMQIMADEGLKQVADTVSVATGVGALAGVLPAISALLTIVWMSIRIWETDTVQRICGRGKP